ncbi:MAG: alkaline phosphatase family protein [Chloroflexota bacterium]
MSKLMVVGFDGATFDVINPLIANGRLPTIAHLLKKGAWGVLHSTVPPITPTAWTTVFTGKNPGKHGIFDFQEIDPQTYARSPVYTDRHLEKTIWDLLGEVNIPSIITDVPYTYPPRPLNGLMLTGYGTPRTNETLFTYPDAWEIVLPSSLHDQIRLAQPTANFDRSWAYIEEWRKVMNGRSRLLKHLITQREWGFFFHVFSITDNLAHVFWTFLDPNHPNYYDRHAADYRQALTDAYEQCDTLLGEMLNWAGPDCNLILMSDHGFGSVYPRQYLFQRLVDGGYLSYDRGENALSMRNHIMKLLIRTYNSFPFLREWVKNLRPNQANALKNSLKSGGLLPSNDAINYQKSQVLPSDFGLQLWLNHQARFASGHLTSEETAVVQTKLSQYLTTDLDQSTHQPIIKSVYQGASQYSGDFAWLGPDLIIENQNFYNPGANRHSSNSRLEGSHTHEGIFVGYGPDIKSANLNSHMTLKDLAPTMLHLLKQPIPPDMDGRVLTEALSEPFLKQNPIQAGTIPAKREAPHAQTKLTADEEEALKNQLRQLGYVD